MTLKVALNYLVNQEVCRTTIVVGPHFVNMFLYVYMFIERQRKKKMCERSLSRLLISCKWSTGCVIHSCTFMYFLTKYISIL